MGRAVAATKGLAQAAHRPSHEGGMSLVFHPLAELFPLIEGKEFAGARNVVSERSRASWHRILLLNRAALLRAWAIYFPAHDFATLRMRNPKLLPPAGWDEHWSAAAREYHQEKKRCLK
jgi:hypothetical protein